MLLTITEACAFLRQGRTKLYSLINQGEISAIKAGKKTLIQKSELERWVSALPSYQSPKQ